MRYLVLLSLVCLAVPTTANAQTHHDNGLWLALFGNGRFDPVAKESPVRWWFDAQYRMLEEADGFSQGIVRPGIGYALDDRHTLWAGYAYVRTSPLGEAEDFDEHRAWQQWTFADSAGKWSFQLRSRLEQRWVQTGDDVGLRWRQMARAQYALTDTPQWSLVAWDEVFFHLNDTDWGARAGLDQNRLFVGVAFKQHPTSPVRVEVGYLNQFIYRREADDGMNHILSVNLFF